MSDSDKVGQLIMAGYRGADGVEAAAELVGDLRVGAVILFADNVQSPQHAAAVTGAFRSAPAPSNRSSPSTTRAARSSAWAHR
jgi:beta-glucosidase-like glycosyl hydrolase